MVTLPRNYNYLSLFTDYKYGSSGQGRSETLGTGWRLGVGGRRRSYVGQRK
jgi:hypothetical protein